MSYPDDNTNGELEKAVSSDELMREILNMRAEQNKFREEYKLLKPHYDELSRKEDEAHQEWLRIRQEKLDAGQTLKEVSSAGKVFDEKILKLEREIARIRSLEEEKNHFKQWAKEMDAKIADRPWRALAKDHQVIGAQQLAFAGSGILGDQIGLGKTLTSLIWADMIGANKVIVFAPKEILKNFQEEIKTWAPDRILIDLVAQPKKMRDFWINGVLKHESINKFIITINIEAWRKDPQLIQDLIELQADAFIIDEAHNLKEERTSAFRGVREMRYAANKCGSCASNNIKHDMGINPSTGYRARYWSCGDCSWATFDLFEVISVKNCLLMTGTIILNKPVEFWTLGFLVDRRIFPNSKYFLEDYCYMIGPNKWKFRQSGLESITKKIGNKLVIRNRKDAGIIVPPQETKIYELNFSPEDYPDQYQAYRDLMVHSAVLLEQDKVLEANVFIALLTRYRQMMTWPENISWKDPYTKEVLYKCTVKESIKVDRAEVLIRELVNAGERVVLFSQFKGPLQELHRRLHNSPYDDSDENDPSVIGAVILDGDTPDHVRAQIRREFDRKTWNENDYNWDVVLCNYRVGGTGLNFTAATQTVILDREWNPGKEEQALGRTNRIGQTRDTTVHILKATSENLSFNVDNFMDELMSAKTDLVTEFDISTKAVAGRMLDMLKKDLGMG